MPLLPGSPETTVNCAPFSNTGGGSPHFRSLPVTITCCEAGAPCARARAVPAIATSPTAHHPSVRRIASLPSFGRMLPPCRRKCGVQEVRCLPVHRDRFLERALELMAQVVLV